MHFITASYSNSYASMLAVCLQSIVDNVQKNNITVYWQDTDDDIICALQQLWPYIGFVKTAYDISGSSCKKIPMKMQLWTEAIEKAWNDSLCFIDNDTVICQTPESLLRDSDVIFTDKDEQFQINTGVVLVNPSKTTIAFFQDWMQETMRIVRDERLLQQAVSPINPYGAADQMALHRLLGYKKEKKIYSYHTTCGEVRLIAVPCSQYNQTNSVPLSPDIWIYHYKGGWRDILFYGRHSPYRPACECWPMQILYLNIYRKVLRAMRAHNVAEDTIKKFCIYTPHYYDMRHGKLRRFKLWKRLCSDKIKSFLAPMNFTTVL